MKKLVILALGIIAFTAAGVAQAAEITLSPESITMKIAAGESGSSAVVGTVVNAPPIPYMVTVQLRAVAGSLPTSWLAAAPVTLSNRGVSAPMLSFAISVPGKAASGTYTAVVQPLVLASTIPISPALRPLMVAVTVAGRCSQAPTVALDTPAGEFWPPNNKVQDVAFSGRVTVPQGCTLARTWFAVVDEYGLYSRSGDITPAADGSFGFSSPILVSRSGDDKDGHSYTITVSAQDEAGTGASDPVSIVVRHDQRGGR